MEFTNEEMVKSLTSLIDETLEEIEEIKKSKFAASEVKLGDDDAGMAGKSKNGDMETKKKEDEDKDEDKKEDMDKGENEKADEDAGKFAQAPSVSKGENEKADEDAGKFAQAPTVSKKEDKDEEDKDEDKMDKMDYGKEIKKSINESESLMKSYVDEKMISLEEKLSKMASAIEALADTPVERKGVPAGVAPLHKSADEVEPLSKSDVASKLFELKKSGEEVDSSDIFRVETGNQLTVNEIASKYGLK